MDENPNNNVATNLTLLCGTHHKEATNRLLTPEQIAQANSKPYYPRHGVSSPYGLHINVLIVRLGSGKANGSASALVSRCPLRRPARFALAPLEFDGFPAIGREPDSESILAQGDAEQVADARASELKTRIHASTIYRENQVRGRRMYLSRMSFAAADVSLWAALAASYLAPFSLVAWLSAVSAVGANISRAVLSEGTPSLSGGESPSPGMSVSDLVNATEG
jgi:hypothetical protein